MSQIDPQLTDNIREKRPTFMKGVWFMVAMIVMAIGLIFGASRLRSAEGPRVAVSAPEPISVVVSPVSLSGNFSLSETYSGLATARRTSQLGFSGGGRIDDIRVDVGDRVEKGATLARLDTRSLQAQLASADASIEEALAGHALALSTVDRQKSLLEKGHVAQQSVDQAIAQADSSMARVQAAKAGANAVRVQIDLAKITAPFAGVIVARSADEGAIAGPGIPILELVESDQLEARIGLPSSAADRLVPGNSYELISDAGPVSAILESVTGVIDPNRRTVMATFSIEAPGSLSSGSVVRVSVDRDVEEDGFWVPVKALTTASRGLWLVYVAAPEDGGFVARHRSVELVHSDGGRAFVRGAVQPDDRLIIDGLQRISPGMPVTPREKVALQHDISE
ncbi:MAG: efflux RND transporter periplasmic adaptor subunit [Hyphomonas sp.]